MKLITSSPASVRAALNDAAERTTKSRGVWQGGSRSKMRAATGETDPADERAHDRGVSLVRWTLGRGSHGLR
jgi:hypothetical protein